MFARCLAIAWICFALNWGSQASAEERLAVVVPTSRATQFSLEDVAQIFLKKRRFWSDGKPIIPVNREAGSRDRNAFTRRVFEDQDRHLIVYWNRQYFLGVLPPATLASGDAVKRFVALEPNAIGYIREELVDESVRVLFYLDYP